MREKGFSFYANKLKNVINIQQTSSRNRQLISKKTK